MTMVLMEELTSSELREKRLQHDLLIPFGSIEAHGPHLPVGTDNIILTSVLRALQGGAGLRNVLVSPMLTATPVNFVRCQGKDGELNPRLSPSIFGRYAFDVLSSFVHIYQPRSLLLVAWHDTPDFMGALRQLCNELKHETGVRNEILRVWILARRFAVSKGLVGEEERHAAKIETSLIQYLSPGLVKDEHRRNVAWTKAEHWGVDWSSFTEEGIFGNAADSSSEIGKLILDHVVSEATQLMAEFFARK